MMIGFTEDLRQFLASVEKQIGVTRSSEALMLPFFLWKSGKSESGDVMMKVK
jgi:hypothetical protein